MEAADCAFLAVISLASSCGTWPGSASTATTGGCWPRSSCRRTARWPAWCAQASSIARPRASIRSCSIARSAWAPLAITSQMPSCSPASRRCCTGAAKASPFARNGVRHRAHVRGAAELLHGSILVCRLRCSAEHHVLSRVAVRGPRCRRPAALRFHRPSAASRLPRCSSACCCTKPRFRSFS